MATCAVLGWCWATYFVAVSPEMKGVRGKVCILIARGRFFPVTRLLERQHSAKFFVVAYTLQCAEVSSLMARARLSLFQSCSAYLVCGRPTSSVSSFMLALL